MFTDRGYHATAIQADEHPASQQSRFGVKQLARLTTPTRPD